MQSVRGGSGQKRRVLGVGDVEGDPAGGEGPVPAGCHSRLGGQGGDDDRRLTNPIESRDRGGDADPLGQVEDAAGALGIADEEVDMSEERKSTRLNSSHVAVSY